MSDFLDKLHEQMEFANFHIDGKIDLFDPKFQRFRHPQKPYKGKDLFVCILGNCQGAVFGDWHNRDEWVTWWETEWKDLTPKERENRKKQSEIFKRRLIQEKHEAMERVQEIFKETEEASHDHPYIKKKRIIPYYGRQIDQRLVIPVWNFERQLQSIQYIYPNGFKHTHESTTFSYGRLIMAETLPDKLYLCEGYATGCSLYEVLGPYIVVCFSASNLLNIALTFKARLPNIDLVICADNDIYNNNNTGMECAEEAASKSGAFLTYPIFDKIPHAKLQEISTPTDFNDLFILGGWEEVETQLEKNKRIVR